MNALRTLFVAMIAAATFSTMQAQNSIAAAAPTANGTTVSAENSTVSAERHDALSILTIYKHVATRKLDIVLKAPVNSTTQIELINNVGDAVRSLYRNTSSDTTETNITMDISGVPAGEYIIMVRSNGSVASTPVTVR